MSKMPPATAAELIPIGTTLQQPTFVNIHIPLYITHCLFCHWVIKQNTWLDEIAQYLKCLDLVFVRHRQRYENTGKINASSIRVGWDTPYLTFPCAQVNVLRYYSQTHQHGRPGFVFIWRWTPQHYSETLALKSLEWWSTMGSTVSAMAFRAFTTHYWSKMGVITPKTGHWIHQSKPSVWNT